MSLTGALPKRVKTGQNAELTYWMQPGTEKLDTLNNLLRGRAIFHPVMEDIHPSPYRAMRLLA